MAWCWVFATILSRRTLANSLNQNSTKNKINLFLSLLKSSDVKKEDPFKEMKKEANIFILKVLIVAIISLLVKIYLFP